MQVGLSGMGTTMEGILWELLGEETSEQGLPPGFRFHPTDEELVTFYLAAKVFNGGFTGVGMVEIDLNRCEPWDLPDIAKLGESEWYFYSLRDRKYPTGLRTNRATGAGYWKATGKDREVYSASCGVLVGMKKTLVFYKGRAPRGEKTKWVLHEYRLEGDFSCRHACKEEWVICRIFYKTAGEKKSPFFQNGDCLLEPSPSSPTPPLPFPQLAEMPTLESPMQFLLHDQPHFMFPKDGHPHHLPPPVSLPQSLPLTNISSLPKPVFHQHPTKETNPVTELCNSLESSPPEQAFFNLVDANPQDPFALGMLPGFFGLSFAGEAVHDLPSWLGTAGGQAEARPLAPWDCSHTQMWQL